MRIYVVREVVREMARAGGATPRRVVEHLEGPTAGSSLVAMYEARDVGTGCMTLPGPGVAVGLGTAIAPADAVSPAMAWGAAAWEWLDAKVAMAEAAWTGHPGHRWIWPRVGTGRVASAEVLSDVPSLRRFLKDRSDWRFVLDPVGMLAPSMLHNAEDHVRRVLETLGSHELCGAVVLSDIVMDPASPHAGLAPIGSGDLSQRGLLDWWRQSCPAELAVILGVDMAIAAQVGWLTSG